MATVSKKRLAKLRAMVDAAEAERMAWAQKTIDGLIADGVQRERILLDMTDDKTGMAIGISPEHPVAVSEIIIDDRGVRFEIRMRGASICGR